MSSLTVRFRVDFGRNEAVGPGKVTLLEHIDECGSLSQAARELGMSYRRAWQLLESLNLTFRLPVATTSVGGKGGGGAALTEFGRDLIKSYRAFDTEVQSRANRHFKSFARKAGRERSKRQVAPVVRLSER
jgi:molybdate transport system regulatory protein